MSHTTLWYPETPTGRASRKPVKCTRHNKPAAFAAMVMAIHNECNSTLDEVPISGGPRACLDTVTEHTLLLCARCLKELCDEGYSNASFNEGADPR